jgi:transposase
MHNGRKAVAERVQQAQADRAVLLARHNLVKVRTQLVNHVRGTAKTVGRQLSSCSTDAFPGTGREEIPAQFRPALGPILDHIERVNDQIQAYEREIDRLCEEVYPQTELLRQVPGVGPITALCYVLTIEDPTRFEKSRTVGAYLGLVPKRKQSGDTEQGAVPEVKALEARLHELVEGFTQRGVQVKGIAPLLLDFPAEVEGREGLLCWLEREPDLSYWHPIETGFMGRRPLPE